jgi:dTDP-glucose 4,6-dehydratase
MARFFIPKPDSCNQSKELNMTNKDTIIVTGGNGFIGTNLVRLLVNSGKYRVVNLDALTYAANPLSLADLEGNSDYVFVKGSITDRELVSSLFRQYQPAGVFHLAAESHVDRSIVHAEDFVRTNVIGTFTMLEAARVYWNDLPDDRKKSFRFLHVSTDEVFGSLGPDGYFTEETPYAPNCLTLPQKPPAIISCAPFITRTDYRSLSPTAQTIMGHINSLKN